MANEHDDTSVSLRQHLEGSISELAKRMDAQFATAEKAVATALATAEKAVAAALVAQDKLTSAAFAAAKEALAEAQSQLVAYKVQANEWRGTLTDLIARSMMRPELLAMFTAADAAREAIKTNFDNKLEALEQRVVKLESAGQRASGKQEVRAEGGVIARWGIGLIVVAVLSILSIAIGLWNAAHK